MCVLWFLPVWEYVYQLDAKATHYLQSSGSEGWHSNLRSVSFRSHFSLFNRAARMVLKVMWSPVVKWSHGALATKCHGQRSRDFFGFWKQVADFRQHQISAYWQSLPRNFVPGAYLRCKRLFAIPATFSRTRSKILKRSYNKNIAEVLATVPLTQGLAANSTVDSIHIIRVLLSENWFHTWLSFMDFSGFHGLLRLDSSWNAQAFPKWVGWCHWTSGGRFIHRTIEACATQLWRVWAYLLPKVTTVVVSQIFIFDP